MMTAAGQVSSACPAVEAGWVMALFLLNEIVLFALAHGETGEGAELYGF